MSKGGLFVSYLHPGTVDGNFHESLLQLMASDHRRGRDSEIYERGGHIGMQSGPRITAARNDVVRHFLKFGAEWLLMIDSDMVFAPDDVWKLLDVADAKERPLVGGLCFGGGRSGIIFPTLYRLRTPDPTNESPIEVIKEYPEDQLVKVDATGAAFLLMHRSLLEHMGREFGETKSPWFIEGSEYKGMAFGEDWAFCMRAKYLGYQLYVHTGVSIGHTKAQVLDEEAYRIYQAKENEFGANGVQAMHKQKITGKGDHGHARSYAVIPQKGKTELTDAVLKQLLAEDACDQIFVMDNGTDLKELNAQRERWRAEFGEGRLAFVDCAGENIHRMWNMGMSIAKGRARGETHNVAILNNDLRLGPHFIKRLSTALRADPMLWAVSPNYDQRKGSGVDYVRGTYPSGMAGFAFMVKGEAFDHPFDEEYGWWYGDTDFALLIASKGYKVGLVYSCAVKHLNDDPAAAMSDERAQIVAQDRERFHAKWARELEPA